MKFVNRIRLGLATNNMDYRELSEKTGISVVMINKYRGGKIPPVDDALKIAKALDTTVESLWYFLPDSVEEN